jgi:Glycine/D-amino acid oxidases (deaminating)
MSRLPRQARCVIIGGGIIGCSTPIIWAAWAGRMSCWSSATSSPAARPGMPPGWWAAPTSANITQLLKYSVELYDRLEAETGRPPAGSATAGCAWPAMPSA